MKNKVKWCPMCDQGWVIIVQEIESNKMYLCCSECETEWTEPNIIEDDNCLKFNTFGKYKIPEILEISRIGWDKYIID